MDNLLKLTDINLNYKTDNNLIKVLQDINLEVKFKETLSIVGESGSGKTSLIMLIGGLEKASSGKIFLKIMILQIWVKTKFLILEEKILV